MTATPTHQVKASQDAEMRYRQFVRSQDAEMRYRQFVRWLAAELVKEAQSSETTPCNECSAISQGAQLA